MKTIELEDIGPVQKLTIPVPENGGLIVLAGRNGLGKSNTLEAVNSLATGKGKLNVRDGALRGEVRGLGATITVGRSTRRMGELEVETLEGKLSIAELVDPGLKDPGAADAKRIKALVSLTSADADASAFHGLLGGKERFEKIVSPSAIEGSDWVLMAERIKRDIEKEARKQDDLAEHAEGKALGLCAIGEDILPNVPDEKALNTGLMEAAQALSKLEERRDNYETAKEREDYAKRRIESLGEGLAGRVAMLKDNRAKCIDWFNIYSSSVANLEEQIAGLQAKLTEAKEKRKEYQTSLADIEQRLSDCRSDQEEIAKLEQSTGKQLEPVSDEEIDRARAVVEEYKRQIEIAAVNRERARKIEQAREQRKIAVEYRREALELRNAAKNTEEILSELVAKSCSVLRVEHGRLVLNTHRGTTYFSDLSHGERWKLAIDVAVNQLGEMGILVVPQEAFEGLDPVARAVINDHAKTRRVLILTAECSASGELEAREFEPEAVSV